MKKLLKTTAIAWVAYRILDLLIHMVLFQNDYLAMQDLYRSDMMDLMWIFFVGSVFVIFGMTYLYSLLKGNLKNKAAHFGGALGLMIMVPAAFYTYASFPVPLDFTIKWFVAGFIQIAITAKIISYLYDKK